MKRWLIFLGLTAIIGASVGYYQYQKPKAAMTDIKTDKVMSASDLVNAFEQDEVQAETTYLDKTIEIQGVIRDKNESGLILNSGNDMVGVLCEFENPDQLSSLNVNDNVKIKGICTGKLLDVVLTRCIVVE